jgi:hypothetical protein
MQITISPSCDSHSISSAAQTAPRRGRPRIHENDSAKKAAYRSRLRLRRLVKVRRAYERKVRAGLIAPSQRDYLAEAKVAWLRGDTELALRLMEQLPSEEDAAYDWQTAHEKRRASQPVKHNRACRENACLCDLALTRGIFLTDAPRGCGLLLSGGYGGEEISLISDARQAESLIGGRRVRPQGHGSGGDEE